ncbi:MAG: hypothetical protein JWO73_776 [Candidatus Taylorbacteria bacterium]|nr:hypothetical protein [Candidatus Taylorbacteria bacterium]
MMSSKPNYKVGLDLTKVAPRSPKVKMGGFVIIGRTIDKCRAKLWGNIGEYHFDCPLDNMLFGFKGIKGEDFKNFVAEGHSDDEIVAWVKENGMPKSDAEVAEWAASAEKVNYAENPDKKAWLEGENARLGLDKDATLFDMLDADDTASFKK